MKKMLLLHSVLFARLNTKHSGICSQIVHKQPPFGWKFYGILIKITQIWSCLSWTLCLATFTFVRPV